MGGWYGKKIPGIKQTCLSLTVVMVMEYDRKNTAGRSEIDKITCAGGCGGSGLCPGQALLLSVGAGYAMAALTGWPWMQPLVLVTGSFLLITGWYQHLNPLRLLKDKDR